MTCACFDASGTVVPPLAGGEALCCVGCGLIIERHQVDDDVGATVREAGVATCFECGSVDGFERIVYAQALGQVAGRWGEAVAAAGWTPMPTLLLDFARDLGLSSTDLSLLTSGESHHFARRSATVFPSKKRLARRMGCSETTVWSRLQRLERAGLIEVHPRRRPNDSKTSNAYTRDGLTRALDLIAENLKAARAPTLGLADLLAALAAEGDQRHRLRCRREDWERKPRPTRQDAVA